MPRLRRTPEEKELDAFRLWVADAMKTKEIAEVLDISEQEVRRKMRGVNSISLGQAIALIHHLGEPYKIGRYLDDR